MDFEYDVSFEVYDPKDFSTTYDILTIPARAPTSGAAVLEVHNILREQLGPEKKAALRNCTVSPKDEDKLRLWCAVLNIEAELSEKSQPQ